MHAMKGGIKKWSFCDKLRSRERDDMHAIIYMVKGKEECLMLLRSRERYDMHAIRLLRWPKTLLRCYDPANGMTCMQ